MSVDVREFGEADKDWAYRLLCPKGGPCRVASCGVLHDPLGLPGFVAWYKGTRIGLATYRIDGVECELLTLDSSTENLGAGTTLIDAVKEAAHIAGCAEVWLVTTNDNTHALRFYQRRGFAIREVRTEAVNDERDTIKPEIPELGNDGIPIRDEIELVIDL